MQQILFYDEEMFICFPHERIKVQRSSVIFAINELK